MVEWMGKKVYIETYSNRKYSGKVIEETKISLCLIDFRGKQVYLKKVNIRLIQEEE